MFRMRMSFGCALAFVLSSCSNPPDERQTSGNRSTSAGGELETTSSSENPLEQMLIGTWESNCIANTGEYFKSELRSIQVHAGSLIQHYKYFEDTECVQPSSVKTIERNFTLGKKAEYTGVANAYEIDMMVVKVQFTIKNDIAAFEFSQNMSFGFNDWQTDVPREISGRRYKSTSKPGPGAGEMYYQIVGVQDGYLAIGDTDGTGNGSSPLSRPQTFPKSVAYVRKN
jgi:hypothetical protein